jgi:AcrR family transcriptional regulator
LPSRPTPKGETSYQAIVQAAYPLFVAKGYHATSIRDISRNCGLTIGGVYTHFKDKAEIFSAVMAVYHPFWQLLPAMDAAQGDTLEDLVQDMARRMVAALGQQREGLNLIFIEVVEFQGRHFGEMFPEYFPRLLQILSRITPQDGSLRPLPIPVLVRSFFGLFFSYFMTSLILNDRLPADEEALHGFVDIYLHGILSNRAASQPTSPAGNSLPDPSSAAGDPYPTVR